MPNTLTDVDALLVELRSVAREGFALDREEFMEGMIALAVPIAGPDGRLVATLSFHAPTLRFEAARALGFLPALRRSARDLAQLIDEPPAA